VSLCTGRFFRFSPKPNLENAEFLTTMFTFVTCTRMQHGCKMQNAIVSCGLFTFLTKIAFSTSLKIDILPGWTAFGFFILLCFFEKGNLRKDRRAAKSVNSTARRCPCASVGVNCELTSLEAWRFLAIALCLAVTRLWSPQRRSSLEKSNFSRALLGVATALDDVGNSQW